MRTARHIFVLAAAVLSVASAGCPRAEPPGYWSYSYQGIDVIAGDPAFARTLAHNVHRLEVTARKLPYIPVRSVLTVDDGDPLLKGELMPEKYKAECWLLVHLITIEGFHKAEFADYLRRLDGGMSPADAFAASFRASVEDLDREVRDALVRGSIRRFVNEVPDEADSESPRKLGAPEADARIAKLTAVVQAADPDRPSGGRN